MLWASRTEIFLDSGRKATVPCGALGLDFGGDTIFAGERELLTHDICGEPPRPLTLEEKLDVATSMLRYLQTFIAKVDAEMQKLKRGKAVDID